MNELSFKFTPENTLLRSTRVYGSKHIIGLVLYTGNDTKIGQHIQLPPFKHSRIEADVTRLTKWLLAGLLMTSSLICGVNAFVSFSNMRSHWYLLPDMNPPHTIVQFLEALTIFALLFNNIVPISLYVTLEVLNIIQGKILASDEDMTDTEKGINTLVRNIGLLSDLGQIHQVCFDKTGTLTTTELAMRYCSVSGRLYNISQDNENNELFFQRRNSNGILTTVGSKHQLLQTLDEEKNSTPSGNNLKDGISDFLVAMVTCSSVIQRQVDEDDPSDTERFVSLSADDLGLMHGAVKLGVSLDSSVGGTKVVSVKGGATQSFEILNELPFDSDRMRMSVVLKSEDNRKFLLCKGAPDVIMRLLESPKDRQDMTAHLKILSGSGYRLLAFAMKEIDDEKWYQEWSATLKSARLIQGSSKRKIALRHLADEMESDMKGLGIVAFENPLRKGMKDDNMSIMI